MHVIVLDRILRHAEAPALARRSEGSLELPHQTHASKRRHVAPHLQRDVAGIGSRKPTPRAMRMPRARAALAARTRAASTPARAFSQIELELPNSPCHERHCDIQV